MPEPSVLSLPVRLTSLLAALVGMGCAGGAASPPPDDTRVWIGTQAGTSDLQIRNDPSGVSASVRFDAEAVWAILPAVYEELGLEPDVWDADRRLLGVRRFTGSRMAGENTLPYLRCATQGTGPGAAGQARVVLAVSTRVEAEDDGGAHIRTEVSGSAASVGGTSRGDTGCVSSGRLEARIARMITARIEGGGGS